MPTASSESASAPKQAVSWRHAKHAVSPATKRGPTTTSPLSTLANRIGEPDAHRARWRPRIASYAVPSTAAMTSAGRGETISRVFPAVEASGFATIAAPSTLRTRADDVCGSSHSRASKSTLSTFGTPRLPSACTIAAASRPFPITATGCPEPGPSLRRSRTPVATRISSILTSAPRPISVSTDDPRFAASSTASSRSRAIPASTEFPLGARTRSFPCVVATISTPGATESRSVCDSTPMREP